MQWSPALPADASQSAHHTTVCRAWSECLRPLGALAQSLSLVTSGSSRLLCPVSASPGAVFGLDREQNLSPPWERLCVGKSAKMAALFMAGTVGLTLLEH